MNGDQAAIVWRAIEAAWRRDEETLQAAILELCESCGPVVSLRMVREAAQTTRTRHLALVPKGDQPRADA